MDPTLDLPGDDALEPMASARAGMVLDGRWRLEACLGRGGMGEVWRARHVTLGRVVTIKVMHAAFATSAAQVQRMMREARAASAVRHPYVVRVEDVGLTEQRVPYIVQEYLEGEDLAALARRSENRLAPEVLVPIVAKVLEALAALHAQGVVHRDIKPENVFLVREAEGVTPRLLDFGIAALTDPAELRLTASASMLGTPAYMSPEQFRSARDVDARTDLWSTGVMLYELLSGALPFPAETFAAMVIAVTTSAPRPLGEVVPSLPARLAGVVMRCLQREPAARFADAPALRQALLDALTERPRRVRRRRSCRWDVRVWGSRWA
ncbi:MAG: serine/threonine-protein kinase [Polyangiales bacterium]